MIDLTSKPLNQQLAYHIGLYEDFARNKTLFKDKRPSPIDVLIQNDDGILKEYFRHINFFNTTSKPLPGDVAFFNSELNRFFKDYGIDYNEAFNNLRKSTKTTYKVKQPIIC